MAKQVTDRQKKIKYVLKYFAIFGLLVAFYTLTRPLNHAESYDSITYALFAENYSFGTAPDSRNILFHATNRLLFLAAHNLGLNIGTLELIASVNILASSFSLILFAGLMKSGFGVAPVSAWTGSAFLGLTYGYWRYSGSAEVYIPSIFLILCSLTLIVRYLDSQKKSSLNLLAAGIVSGLAVLYYQPNFIALFVTIPILFLKPTRLVDFTIYTLTGALIVLTGIVCSFLAINAGFPGFVELAGYASSRFEEFNDPPELPVATKKLLLASGHDVVSAHWTRTIDFVREFLDPHIPGCVYNFNVVVYAGKGIQHFTAVSAILFFPIVVLFARIHWIAYCQWRISQPANRTIFLACWFALMTLIVATLDPGSFEGWIPVLVPLAGLLTIFVFEPCRILGKQKTVLIFLVLLMCYNFFGGLLLWRNLSGDYYYHKTDWIRQELTENDTVLFNEHDYRILDYLIYYSDVHVVYLIGQDEVAIGRNTPGIFSMQLEDFLALYQNGDSNNRLFVLDDVLSPDPAIENCRYGREKMKSATRLAERLMGRTTLVDTGVFGKTYQVDP